jgi:signal transduction histidine kinase/ActR/RegA family two-component response regulator
MKSIKALEEEIERLNRESSILSIIAQTINQSVDLHEILNNTLDKVIELIPVSAVGLYLLDEREKSLVFAAHRGFSRNFAKAMRTLKLGEGISGGAAASGEPFFSEDISAHSNALTHAIQEGVTSLVVIPLKSQTKIYGTLLINWKQPHHFTPSEKNLFVSIGQMISNAMERATLYTENVKRLEEQRRLYSISQEIASRLELKVILQKIIENVVALLGAEAGEISLWDNRRQSYVTVIVHGLSGSLVGREVSLQEGIVGEVCTKKVLVLYEDYEHHPHREERLAPYHFKEVVGVPLNVRQMIIGTMVVATSDPGKHFEQNEIDLLYNFAHQAAIAIGNARLYEDSLSQIRQLTTLYQIGKVLSSTLDIQELLKKALDVLKDLLGYSLCSILFLDREKNELFIMEVTGGREEIRQKRFRVGIDGIVGYVANTGEPLYIPDVSKDSRYVEGLPGVKSEAAFPLKVRDQVIGVLNIESTEEAQFDEENLKVLSSFANQVSISIQNAQLFSDLKETLRELKQAQDQIIQAEKLRALGEMASGVAHDFNNVLAVILGNIQLLVHQLDRLSLPEIREQLRIIEQSSKDGAETVRRIQEFTGVRRDKEFITLSINSLIKEVITITQPRWKDQTQARGIQITLTSDLEDVPPVFGNASELREVLTNMIFNAVDAMPEGGDIILSAHAMTNWVEVRVSDTGVGMSDEVKKRVFDPFFSTKGVTNSGLGMSVSYGIVKRHGGEILIESRAGGGACFIIHLPFVHADEEVAPVPEVPEKEVASARILVIDDEDSVRDILSRMLKAKGHEVVAVPDGQQGIDQFRSERFDLVFTDLGMPRVSGWEVGKAVKKINPSVPVAMITGWGMELNREKMSENGIDMMISKPFNLEQLIQLVSDAIELKKTYQSHAP